ncbi:hypothetical protein HCC30_21870 [Streptomyces sp. HNM0574]|nr:hypothetical protein [Streptomyces sp. HNM0574]
MLSPEVFASVAATVRDANSGMSVDVAERIVTEAVAFIAACAAPGGKGLRPSRIVDEGWHALILHTLVYRELCERLGRFVHHVPERPDPTRYDPGAMDRTQNAIRALGYTPDPMLWAGPLDDTIPVSANCTHGPGGEEGTCTGDPDGDGPSGPN